MNMKIGERLRQQRERLKLTLGQVAEYEDIGRQYLSKLELGINTPPTWPLLARLARRYHVSSDYLLGLVDNTAGRADLAPEEEALLIAWQSLPEEQRLVMLNLLQDDAALGVLLSAVTALGALNQQMKPRIIGGEE
jgi:transcriptional regulator with XRE-family HTH domain